jgi:hypothetical protein
VFEDGCRLRCCAVQSGTCLPTFQRCLLPPSTGRFVRPKEDNIDTGLRKWIVRMGGEWTGSRCVWWRSLVLVALNLQVSCQKVCRFCIHFWF